MTKRKPTLIPSNVPPRGGTTIEASVTTVTSRQFSGPLPAPETLAEYNRIVPGAAERIIAMAERQQQHRHEMESSVVRRNLDAQVRGQRMAFALSLFVIIGGFILMGFGHSGYGIATVITALVALVAVFITGRSQQAKERREKRAGAAAPSQD